MGIQDAIDAGVFEDSGISDETINELKEKIAAAGIPIIALLTEVFADDTSAPTATELAEMATAAKEVTEFLTEQSLKKLEQEMVLVALGEMLAGAMADED